MTKIIKKILFSEKTKNFKLFTVFQTILTQVRSLAANMLKQVKKYYQELYRFLFAVISLSADAARYTYSTYFMNIFSNFFGSVPYCLIIYFGIQVITLLAYGIWYGYEMYLITHNENYITTTTPIYQQALREVWDLRRTITAENSAFYNLVEQNVQSPFTFRPEQWIKVPEEYRWRLSEPFTYFYGPDWSVNILSQWWRDYQEICDFRGANWQSTVEEFARMKMHYQRSLQYPVGAPERLRVDTLYAHYEQGWHAAQRYRVVSPYVNQTYDLLAQAKETVESAKANTEHYPLKAWAVFSIVALSAISVCYVVAKTSIAVGVLN